MTKYIETIIALSEKLVLPIKSRHPNYAAKAVVRSNSAGAT